MLKYLVAALAIVIASIFVFVDSSTLGLTVVNTAIKVSKAYEVERNIPFNKNPSLRLDIYLSTNPEKSQAHYKAPVVVFFYGGGWSWGSKSLFHFVADAFTRKGYTVVIPDYTKYPQGKFPDFLNDSADALVWTYNNISRYHGNPEKIFLLGHSAGAYIAALLGSDPTYISKAGGHTDMIKAIAGIAGPYNFTPKEQIYIDIFGQENFELMKANTHVSGNEPPMLLLHGKGDTTVGKFNYETLYEKISQEQGVVELKLYGQDITHTNILLKLHPWFAGDVNVTDDIDQFLTRQSG